ncbi:MAG: hypothetical protein WCC06_02610 [Candidatus Aminicenantales bacterium]
MKKTFFGCWLLLMLSVLLSGAKVSTGILGGYALTSERNYGTGLTYGLNFCFEVSKSLAFELSGFRFQCPVNSAPEGLSQGKLSVLPVLLSLQTRFPVNGNVYIPYIILGGGYYITHFTMDSAVSAQWEDVGFRIEEKIENAFAVHFGVGIEVFLNSKISVYFDARYGYARSNGSRTLSDSSSGEKIPETLESFNLDTLLIGMGIKFSF